MVKHEQAHFRAKVIRIGNAEGVIIPKIDRDFLGIKIGDHLNINLQKCAEHEDDSD